MSDSQALLQEGLAAFRARAYDDALRAWRTLLEQTPDHPQVKELVARTETLAAEGQIVNQLKEELTDLREELALTRDSRNDLLLEMARLHKRYEEREAHLWRMQEAREWELREALANAELKAFDADPNTSDLDEEALAEAASATLDHAFPPTPKRGDTSADAEALSNAQDQVRVLRQELQAAHERIVELEQIVFQYEHDERDLVGRAFEDNHALYMDEPDAPAPFEALQPVRIETPVPAELTARGEQLPGDEASEDAQTSHSAAPLPQDHRDDAKVETPPPPVEAPAPEDDDTLASEGRPTTQRSKSLTGDFRKDIADDARDDTGSFDPADDAASDLPAAGETVSDALVEGVIEETSGLFDIRSDALSARDLPSKRAALDDPAETALVPEAEDDPFADEDPFAELKDDAEDTRSDDEDPFAALKDDVSSDTAPQSAPPLGFEALGPDDATSDADATTHTGDAQEAPASDDAPDELDALPLARSPEDASDTAEFDLQPIDDINIDDGFTNELADALSSTPRPPRIETGIQPELPELDFEDDVVEAILPEELERRATWIPVRHKADPVIENPIAQYLITHIDGVSTFMELRGTVGLPPTAVDSGFRYLLEHDIIRAKPN